MITPFELLEDELAKYVKAKKKSTDAFNEGGISWMLHEEHIKNLNPKIEIYEKAVNQLKTK